MQQYHVPLKTCIYTYHHHQQRRVRITASGDFSVSSSSSLDQSALYRALSLQRSWVTSASKIDLKLSVLSHGKFFEDMHYGSFLDEFIDGVTSSTLWHQLKLDLQVKAISTTDFGGLVMECELYELPENWKPSPRATRFPYTLQSDELRVELPPSVPILTLHTISISLDLVSLPACAPEVLTATSPGNARDEHEAVSSSLSPTSTATTPLSPVSSRQASSSATSTYSSQSGYALTQCTSPEVKPFDSGILLLLADCALRSTVYGTSTWLPPSVTETPIDSNGLSLSACAPGVFIPDHDSDISFRSQFLTMVSEGMASIIEHTESEELRRKAKALVLNDRREQSAQQSGGYQQVPDKNETKGSIINALWVRMQRSDARSKLQSNPARILNTQTGPINTCDDGCHEFFSDALLMNSCSPHHQPHYEGGLNSACLTEGNPCNAMDREEEDSQEFEIDLEDSDASDMLVFPGTNSASCLANDMDTLDRSSSPHFVFPTSEYHNLLQTSSPPPSSHVPISDDLLEISSPIRFSGEQGRNVGVPRESSPILVPSEMFDGQAMLNGRDAGKKDADEIVSIGAVGETDIWYQSQVALLSHNS